MKKNNNLFNPVIIMVMIGLLFAACAPGDIDRIPVSGQEQPGAAGQPAYGEAEPAGDMGTNTELPPNHPVCPTPTPNAEIGETGDGETGVGEAVTGPASPPNSVTGDQSSGAPAPETMDQLLDQVNQGPGNDRNGQTSGETGAGPEPGSETLPGELPNSPGSVSGSAETAAPTFGDLIGEVFGQVLGTSEPGGVSFEPPPPSPTPCP